MDRSKHIEPKQLNEEKTNRDINSTFFKHLRCIDDSLYGVELGKAQIEHRKLIIVGFFILQYAKLRILELYWFLLKFCDPSNFEESEIDTVSLYLALAENNVLDGMKQDKAEEWSNSRNEDCIDNFEAYSSGIFFPRTCCTTHAELDEREPGLFKETFRATETICLCGKTFC